MPDIHVPQLEDHEPSGSHTRGKSIAKLLLEMVLISAGVFLGMMRTVYLRPLSIDREGFFAGIGAYLSDATYLEPTLLKTYDDLLPKIDQALAGAK